MNTTKRMALSFGLTLGIFTFLLATTASAHVVVRPAEVLTASFQIFTVSVPNEKDQPNTSLKLLIPRSLKHVTPTVKQGWNIDIEKEGEGEAAVVTSLTWSGNSIPADFREDFTFSAQTAAKPAEIQWKAYQAYADGQTVAWDASKDKQPKKAGGSPDFSTSGPFSVTSVVTKTEAAGQQAGNDSRLAGRAWFASIAAIILALTAVFLATRKKA